MKILIVGAGATGAYFGARLAAAGRDVTFLVHEKRAQFLAQRGLRIAGTDPELRIEPKLLTAGQLQETFDVVVLTVKASALAAAIADLAPAVGPDTVIIPFLNGLGHMDALVAAFGAEKVLGSVVHLVGTINGEGDIEVRDPISRWTIGEQNGGEMGELSPRVQVLLEEITVPGITAVAVPNGIATMWEKWVFIVTAATVTCLMRGSVGDIVQCPGGSDFVGTVLAEAAAMSAAAGFPVSAQELAGSLSFLTAPGSLFTSSLYRDVTAGLPHEGEHIVGDFVRRARELGVDAPLLNLALLQLRVHDAGMARRS